MFTIAQQHGLLNVSSSSNRENKDNYYRIFIFEENGVEKLLGLREVLFLPPDFRATQEKLRDFESVCTLDNDCVVSQNIASVS